MTLVGQEEIEQLAHFRIVLDDQDRAVARGLGLPMGESMRDLGIRGMTGYGNFRNQ